MNIVFAVLCRLSGDGLMFDDLNVLEILKLGFVGIAFVLAALAYLLLKAEQKWIGHAQK